MFKKTLVALVALTLSTPLYAGSATAKIYVWRNEQGVLVFSDSPRPGAEEVKVKPQNTVKSNVDTSILDIKPQELKDDYDINITQPENNATIRDNTGSVHVTGLIKPHYKKGYKIQLYLDNAPYEKPQRPALFALREVDRGEHQIKMELIDDKGKVIASSDTITFYMHRARVNNGAR